ncbi:MAG: type II toxin-antitoxin system HicA family toxin [Rhodothermia bacterium]|nr:type II toxin-antitoxin system HicA family toxin [Rhodothermia bacterium]
MKLRDVIKLIENDGWRSARTRGGHRQYKHPGKQAPSPHAYSTWVDVPA